MSHSHEHPKIFRRASESIRDMVESLPILSREMVTCKMSKQDLYETMEHQQRQSQRQSFESSNNNRKSHTSIDSAGGGDAADDDRSGTPRQRRRSSNSLKMMDDSSLEFVMDSLRRHSSSTTSVSLSSPRTTATESGNVIRAAEAATAAAAAAAAAVSSSSSMPFSEPVKTRGGGSEEMTIMVQQEQEEQVPYPKKNSKSKNATSINMISSTNKSIPEDESIEEGFVMKPFHPDDDGTMIATDGRGGGCCGCGVWKSFDLDPAAKGYAILGICRGTIIMSNVFLSSTLIYLASVDAGCVEEGILIDDCTGKTHGFKPTSLITNISVVTGLLAAFLSPVLGAIIDYTPYRRQLGIFTAALATTIQAVQIGTTQKTWFPMAILQSIVGFIFFIQVMATFAYLPDMARNVGGDVMNHFTKWFVFIQFASEIVFMIIIIGSGIILQLNTVTTGQAGQALSSLACIVGFTYAWGKLIPNRPASKVLPKGHWLILEGFRQNYRTVKTIAKHYRKGLYWFMISSTVGEAGVSALVPVGVTFLTEEVKLGGLEIGIVFALALITALFGSFLGAAITSRTNPKTSLICCMMYFLVVTLAGAFALVEERSYLGFVWGGFWGIGLGWFYPVGNLMFSLCLPRGSENEMTGLYIYTNQVLAWLPPFVFSIIIESGLSSRWGFMSLLIFQSLTILTLVCGMAPWSEVLEEAEKVVKDENCIDDDNYNNNNNDNDNGSELK